MSDDEREEEKQEEPPPPPPVKHETRELPKMPTFEDESGRSEAQVRMEEEKKKRQAREAEEWREYEESRKAEREKEEEEIQQLRERREQRKKERVEEEKRLNELRAVEEQKRRAEEDERQRKKREEEARRTEEREKKKYELMERSKITGKPNFVIIKTADGHSELKDSSSAHKAELTKSKEQLEAERKAILEQRIQPLRADGLDPAALKDKAKELHQLISKLEGDKYDLEQRFKQQQLDMNDLSERARQMNKGGKEKKAKQAEPLNDNADALAEKIHGIPPKITMYSEYERIKDHRTFGDRKTLYTGPLYVDDYERVRPTKKVVMTEAGAQAVGDADPEPDEPEFTPKPQPPKQAAPPPAPEPEPEPEAQEEVEVA